MMGRKNKAEHINGGEGLKEMWYLHMSEQGRKDLEMGGEWNRTLRRHNEPLLWGKDGEHRGWYNGWVWNMPPIGWSGRLQYWELTRGTNACIWSTEAAVSSIPLICVPCLLVISFSESSFYPEPGIFLCLRTVSSHVVPGLEDPCFNSKQSLKRT